MSEPTVFGPGQSSSDTSVNIVRGTHTQLILFLVFNIWTSHFGLPLLLAIIIFSRRIQRHATFINLCLSFIVVGFSSSLLVYAGKTTGPEPSKLLCLFQSSLLYGMPSLTSASALALVLQMFLVIRASYYGKEMLDRDHVVRFWVMIAFPWLAFLVFVLATAIVGAMDPTKISRNRRFFYCSVEALSLTNTITTFAAFLLFATFVLEVWTIIILYKRWVAVGRRVSGVRWDMELSLPLRILAFGMFVIISLSLSLLSIKSPESPVPDLVIASAATVVMIIFGTQTDVINVLCFWRRSPWRTNSDCKAPSISSIDKGDLVKPKVASPTWPQIQVRAV